MSVYFVAKQDFLLGKWLSTPFRTNSFTVPVYDIGRHSVHTVDLAVHHRLSIWGVSIEVFGRWAGRGQVENLDRGRKKT